MFHAITYAYITYVCSFHVIIIMVWYVMGVNLECLIACVIPILLTATSVPLVLVHANSDAQTGAPEEKESMYNIIIL